MSSERSLTLVPMPVPTSTKCSNSFSIVKRIADLHKAKIEIADNLDKKGLKINVYFPLGSAS